MKFKKLIVPFLAACTAVTAAVGLAACGDDTDKDKDKDKDTATTITYQFTGEFTNDTLKGYGFDYHVLLNLTSDGKVSGSGYNCLSMDARPASENSGFSKRWFRGSWEETKNEEDQDCVKITAIYDADAKNGMSGGSLLTNTSTYYVVKKSDGSLNNFRLQTPIFSGTTEYMTQMSQNKTPLKDADAFIQANLYTWTAPTGYEAVFETTSESQVTAKIYLMPEGVADVYSGKQVPETTEYKFVKGESWQWTYKDGALKVKDYTATVSGTTATLEYTVSVMGHNMSYKYSCADISKLTPTDGEPEATPIVTFTNEANTIKFYADHTAKMSAYGGMVHPTFTWTIAGGVITLTDAENSSKTYTSTTDGGVVSIVYTDSLGGNPISITFTCNDISALTA